MLLGVFHFSVVGNAFGGHPNKQGIDFRGQNPELSLPQYINLVNLPNEFDGIKNLSRNRLVNLYRTKIADRERGALKRMAALMARYPALTPYVQGDPRGCAVYVLRPGDVPEGKAADAYYSRGVPVY